MLCNGIYEKLGNTPIVKIKTKDRDNINLFVKLEYYNPTGSVKDRAASHIIDKLLHQGEINKDVLVIESSSGNFGIALAAYCLQKGLDFCCVTDPNITKANMTMLQALCNRIIIVNDIDSNGGYLLNRIKKVNELLIEYPNSYWINQYNNVYNAEAYYKTLGVEICNQLKKIDYVFVSVSSGGTITGVSQKVKEVFPNAKVIAVDVEGSVIFGGQPQKRYIPGIGSSMQPGILQSAKIDEVVIVDEYKSILCCHELLREHAIFCGGSSGSVFAAIKEYFKNREYDIKPNVVTIFPDKGDRYINSVYSKSWVKRYIKK